ncbi:hypothetical protein EHE19_000255 [Ruminiclostridium herbifermentans]|uniref:Uncharacterized protein n=1 Tax=Ruminiclostridium herbifermentans TaxID=2488810 RepID=A0A4U7JIL0_9FIRM|nr:hypothetical protein [Ruminiclostridium herbifermentans]QNU67027.1 hypothetical protein EHE19_000255 [Ruminiclostridium herbifermentans]
MCVTMLEEKTYGVFDIIDSSNGITIKDLIDNLNRKYSRTFFFNAHVSLDDLIETNVLIGRLKIDNDYIYITERGKQYLSTLK